MNADQRRLAPAGTVLLSDYKSMSGRRAPVVRSFCYLRLSVFICGLLFLTGCESGGHFTLFGYTTRPPVDESIRTVYVPQAENTTYLRGIEHELTKQVIRELGMSPYRVTSDRSKADTELLMKVVANRKATIIMNQLGETRDAEVFLNIEVVWKDLRPGHTGDILSNPQRFDAQEKPLPGDAPPQPPAAIPLLVTPSAHFAPELGGSYLSAHQQAVTRAARKIVNMMEVWR